MKKMKSMGLFLESKQEEDDDEEDKEERDFGEVDFEFFLFYYLIVLFN